MGPGTLGTVLLCEILLTYLCTGSYKNLPYKMLKAYDILPLSVLGCTRKVDLSRFATLRGGVHISRPQLEKVWVPLSSLPYSARATATSMLMFLHQLKAAPRSYGAIVSAAQIIVRQFKHDLLEIYVVRNLGDQRHHDSQRLCFLCIRTM